MPIPNTITRTLDLPHPQDRVWSAISTPEGLSSWFGHKVEGDVAPGSEVLMTWNEGHVAHLSV
ncbi:MAG: ATPase, partial [Frankiales bacterium]|nr:ATPase [Frankiales bacterium]